jgi:hypothetical protein
MLLWPCLCLTFLTSPGFILSVFYSSPVRAQFGIVTHEAEEALGKFCFWAPWVSIALNVSALYVTRKRESLESAWSVWMIVSVVCGAVSLAWGALIAIWS